MRFAKFIFLCILVLYIATVALLFIYKAFAIAGILALLGIITFIADFIITKVKKRRNKPYQIPAEMERDLQYLEGRYTESGGKINPQNLLWELAKSKQRGAYRLNQTEPGVRIPDVPVQYHGERNIISNDVDTGITGHTSEHSRPQRDYRKGLFGRRR